MSEPSFDSTHALRFDLPRGAVHTPGDGERVLLIPASALDDLVLSASPAAVDALGRSLGSAIGRRAAARMGNAAEASMEAFVTQVAGEAAVAGLGALSVERWGRALVVAVEGSSVPGTLLGSIVAAALGAASGRDVSHTQLSRDDRVARFFIGSEAACRRLGDWLASGMAWGEAVVKLHGGTA